MPPMQRNRSTTRQHPMKCGAYTYVGAGGGQYVGCYNNCERIDRPVACADALGAFKIVEYLRLDCVIVDRHDPEPEATA